MKRTVAVVALTAAVLAVAFLVYDLVRPAAAPCDSIFEQTATVLGSRVEGLRAKGELLIGRQKVQDLSERAQVVALNLKTCCIVVRAGNLDSSQFLQCQDSAQRYQQQLESVAASVAAADNARAEGQPDLADIKIAEIEVLLEQSRAQAEALVKTVSVLAATPPTNPTTPPTPVARPTPVEPARARPQAASGAEIEPNNDILSPNQITVGAAIDGAIDEGRDNDFYRFTGPSDRRDRFRVTIENRSTTWSPWLGLYNADKASIFSTQQITAGANLAHEFAAEVGAEYFLHIAPVYDGGGAYRMTIEALGAFDSHEPNETILTATAFDIAAPIEGSIMDPGDTDFYRFVAPCAGATRVKVLAENRSTTWAPWIAFYGADKSRQQAQQSTTAGADIALENEVQPGSTYYVQVGQIYDSSGGYAVRLSFE